MPITFPQALAQATSDLRGRPDYRSIAFRVDGASVSAAKAAETYDDLALALKTAAAAKRPVPEDTLRAARRLTAAIVDSNTAMRSKQPLNTSRTITPEAAVSYNRTLLQVQDGLDDLIAKQKAAESGGPPSRTATAPATSGKASGTSSDTPSGTSSDTSSGDKKKPPTWYGGTNWSHPQNSIELG